MPDSFRQLVESVNISIAESTGGDRCHSIAHLMRFPGTANWPTAAKVKRGRGITQASILQPDNGRTVTIEKMAGFMQPEPLRESGRPKISIGEVPFLTADDLGLSQFDELHYLINQPEGQDRSPVERARGGR